MDDDELDVTLDRQDGVIARSQAARHGLTDNDIRRLIRRREWVRVHPRVYVNHTGPLTWRQRAWAAVLAVWPAALCGESALRADDGPGRRGFDDSGAVDVAIDRKRTLRVRIDGVRVHHLAGFGPKVQWNMSPPRVRIEEVVLDLAARAPTEFQAIAIVSNAVQSRRTTADRLLKALGRRPRIDRREFLELLLADVADGTCSLLEHGYLDRVERPHGLPRGQRQVGASARGPIYRDVTYVEQQQVVELDGRLFHDNASARDADLDRDLDAAVDRLATVRLGWGQVFDRPCATAVRIGKLLQHRGWGGTPTSCPQCARDAGGELAG